MGMSIYKLIINLIKIVRRKTKDENVNDKELFLNENLTFLNNIVELNSSGMYYVDEKGVLKYCNKAFADYLGADRNNLIGNDFSFLYSKDFGDIYYNVEKELCCTKEKQTYIAKLSSNNQVLNNVLLTEKRILNNNNEIRGIIGNITDVSDVLIANQKINRMLKLKEAMLDLNQIIIKENDINVLLDLVLKKITAAIDKADIGAVLVLDKKGDVKIVASRGYADDEVKNFSIKLDEVFYMKKTNGVIGQTIIINNIQSFDPIDHKRALESKDKDKLNCSLSTPILLNGELYGFINIESTLNNAFDDNDIEVLDYLKKQIEIGISKNLLYEETIYLSRYDKLTNLYNRAYFEELFNNALEMAEKNNEKFLFLIIDLNWLKPINDNYGHLAGDELIRVFATTLKNRLGNTNILARLGGDEFAAIIFDMNSNQLVQMLERLSTEFKENPIYFEDNIFNCSFSYGMSCYMESGNNYNTLLKAADENMYEYKNKFKATNHSKEYRLLTSRL